MDKKTFWIAYTLLVIGLLFIIELWAPIAYIYKIFLKIFLMLLPLIWVSRSFFAPDTKKLKVPLLLGAGAILIIQGAYLVLRQEYRNS
jgi:hypothetical protein|tara:strand:+ start:88191 stop:88454 length:264 start_codon:yes stop_codon:yes gene_type:complete